MANKRVYDILINGLNDIFSRYKVEKSLVDDVFNLINYNCKPYTNKDNKRIIVFNGNTYYKCRYNGKYYNEEECVFDNKGAYKGYSKACFKLWTNLYYKIKKLKADIGTKALAGEDIESLKIELNKLQKIMDNPDTFKDIALGGFDKDYFIKGV